jgi:hypothetical protein
MTPDLAPDEIMLGVRLDIWPPNHGWSFMEYSRRHGDYAIVGVAALVVINSINSIEKIDRLDNNFELAETPSTNTGFSFACVGQLPEEAFKGTFANPLSDLETNPSLDEDIIIEGNDNNKSNDLTVEIPL